MPISILRDSIPVKDILGVKLALLDYSAAVAAIENLSRKPKASAVSFCNTHLVAEAAHEKSFGDVLRTFDLNLPDGMPLVWALNHRGATLKDRVYGPYLMKAFLSPRGEGPGLRHFLLGSTPELLAALEEQLRLLNPQIQIAGTCSPPFRALSESDEESIANQINAVNADCVWVAMGGVKQEKWIAKNIHRFHRGVFLAVGDAFSLLAGKSAFAPAWMQRVGMTWLYRLLLNPRRLFGRYLKYNFLFVFHLLRS